MEKTYIDILVELRKNIENDIIPRKGRERILKLIAKLEEELYPYSA